MSGSPSRSVGFEPDGGFRAIRTPRHRNAAGEGRPRRTRLPAFLGMTGDAGAALSNLRVLVVGLGSIGHLIALHLARLHVAALRLVDPAVYKPASLETHAALPPSAVGRPKALWCGRMAKAVSPGTDVAVFAGRVQDLPLAALEGIDVVSMATDNLQAEVHTAQRCIRHRVPLVQAAVAGEMLISQTRVWASRDGSGPCPACEFQDGAEWSDAAQTTLYRCTGEGQAQRIETAPAPTMSVSSLCGLAAGLATTVVLRRALGLGPSLDDTVTEWCGYTMTAVTSPLRRSPHCRLDHSAWDTVRLARPIAEHSLRELAVSALGPGPLPDDLAFTVGDDLVLVALVRCCGWPQPVARFARIDQAVASCPRCGKRLLPQTFDAHREVPADVLGPLIDRPLAQLGASRARAAVVHGAGRSFLCLHARRAARAPSPDTAQAAAGLSSLNDPKKGGPL